MTDICHSEAGTGRPLILLHGFCETHAVWTQFADALSEHYKVLLPDLPGFGRSVLPQESFSLDQIAAGVLQWCAPWKAERPVVIGHSLGGYITLAMARREPAAFAGLGLFHSTASADTEEKKKNRNKTIEFVRKHGVGAYTQTFVPGLFYRKDHPSIPFVHKMAAATTASSLTRYAAAMRDRPSSEDVIRTSTVPVLFVAGENDPLAPPDHLREQARTTPLGVFHSLPATGHMGMFERKGDALNCVRNFMQETSDFAV